MIKATFYIGPAFFLSLINWLVILILGYETAQATWLKISALFLCHAAVFGFALMFIQYRDMKLFLLIYLLGKFLRFFLLFSILILLYTSSYSTFYVLLLPSLLLFLAALIADNIVILRYAYQNLQIKPSELF